MDKRKENNFGKILILSGGIASFGIGWVGIFVPGLPTTIFWIIAALAFIRTNKRLYEYIINHKTFGSNIKAFIEEGKISKKGKIVSIISMVVFSIISIIFVRIFWVKILILLAAVIGCLWVFSLPLVSEQNSDR